MELLACMKKEFLQLFRRGKLFVFLGIPVGIAILSFIMNLLLNQFAYNGITVGMDEITVGTSLMFFNSFILVYFLVPVIIMCGSVVSKEIKDKKWILPVCSGISVKNMVLAKFIVHVLTIMISVVIGFLINLALAGTVFDWNITSDIILMSLLGLVVTVMFYSSLSIALSSITKKTIVAILVPILIMIVGEAIAMQLNFQNYTPYFFSGLMMTGGIAVTTVQWIVAPLVTAFILAGMIIWATLNPRLSIV